MIPQLIQGDILTVHTGIITHQVNTQGKMGRGLALQIARKWPVVFEKYKRSNWTPGMIQLVPVQISPRLFVCNLAEQQYYGRADRCHTLYPAVSEAFRKLNTWAQKRVLQLYIPWRMGCGNAGGDWDMYSAIIQEECADAIICKP